MMYKKHNMKSYYLIFFFFGISFSVAAQQINKVLIIGIDGCRPDALVAAQTPDIDNLIPQSIYSLDVLNNDITFSGPGWSAMLTGVWHEKHGVTDNSFDGSNYENYPHFFQRMKQYNSNLITASICHWGPINNFIANDAFTDFKLNVNSDEAVAVEAVSYLNANDPDALFLHFDDVDHAGHSFGFSPQIPEYIEAIENVDTGIGIVLNALEQRPNYDNENWLILVSTDHGGIGSSHGGNSIEEQNIFILASNKNFTSEQIVKDSTVTIIPLPDNCLDESIELTFDGINDYVNIPNNGLFDFGADQDFTVECRVRTNVAADVSIVGNKNWNSGLNKGFVFSFRFPSGPEWKVNIGDGTNRADINTGGEIADGEWHTLSVTFDRDGSMKMYEDGLLLDSTDISMIGDIDTDFDVRFGADGEGGFNYNGSIAEVRIWNEILKAPAITDWFCTSLDIDHPNIGNLLGYWKMNEGMGSDMVLDSGSFTNHGNIEGATWMIPDTVLVEYDYTQTPRITDVAVTALTHLCIPIDASWQLDGQSIIPECTMTNTNELTDSNWLFEVYPNPFNGEIKLTTNLPFSERLGFVEIYNLNGSKVFEINIHDETTFDTFDWLDGIYVLRFNINNQVGIKKLVKSGR